MSKPRGAQKSNNTEKENVNPSKTSDAAVQSTGTKRKSFKGVFEESEETPSKIAKKFEKLSLSCLKTLLLKSTEQQKKEILILKLTDVEKLRSIEIVGKPLNFGLCDINGITIEAVVFQKADQLRLKSILNGNPSENGIVVLTGWTWYINNSAFMTSYMLKDKINIGRETLSEFISNKDLISSSLTVFKLSDSLERLIVSRCYSIHETTWFMVAREPKYFYQSYSGVLICDGNFFGIIAVEMNDDGGLKSHYKFDLDGVFKLKNVNAKLFDVAHRNLGEKELKYFRLTNVQRPCVFYVDEKSDIVENDSIAVEFGTKELKDIGYPESSEEVSKVHLSELIKITKAK